MRLTSPTTLDRFRGCLLGLAIGDALGAQVEFQAPGTFPPVSGMLAGGPFELEAGQWTDDTSMALCLAESLIECDGFDPRDQMDRYVRWWREGYFSSTGSCFDIGLTTRSALQRYLDTGDPLAGSTDPMSAGNGSLMRLAPVALFHAAGREEAIRLAGESSRTTHGAEEAVTACRQFAAVLLDALAGATKDQVLAHVRETSRPVASGYVVETLEAAMWAFRGSNSFAEALLKAVNLGDDSDTVGAVCGQVAGAFYGVGAIPDEWLAVLAQREMIDGMAEALYRKGKGSPSPPDT